MIAEDDAGRAAYEAELVTAADVALDAALGRLVMAEARMSSAAKHHPLVKRLDEDLAGDGLTRIVKRNVQMRAFLLRMLDPEDLGHAVNASVRAGARQLLGLPAADTP